MRSIDLESNRDATRACASHRRESACENYAADRAEDPPPIPCRCGLCYSQSISVFGRQSARTCFGPLATPFFASAYNVGDEDRTPCRCPAATPPRKETLSFASPRKPNDSPEYRPAASPHPYSASGAACARARRTIEEPSRESVFPHFAGTKTTAMSAWPGPSF